MKKLILISVLASFATLLNAQLVTQDDGKYYDHTGKLYSGTYVEYYPSGNIRVEMAVVEGEKHGISTLYFDNQQKQEIRSFHANKMDGIWITWNEQGVKVGEASYKLGIKDGKWTIWDDQGTMRYEMHYINGEKSGTWKIWNENGKLVGEKTY